MSDIVTPGWYPAPDNSPQLWYFDGSRWADDPIAEIERRITEMIQPHLEHMFREGFKHAVATLGSMS